LIHLTLLHQLHNPYSIKWWWLQIVKEAVITYFLDFVIAFPCRNGEKH
jgi:hypothetical protein